MDAPDLRRRPLTTRDAACAIAGAGLLVRLRVPPNAISMASVLFAGSAAFLIAASAAQPPRWHALLLVAAAGGIQLRLLCNMFDGMVAIAGGQRSASGELYNEIPDRIADVVILVAAGYAARPHPHALDLGWACAVLAVLTAYLRAAGQALGCAPTFLGPMAKPQRMAAMTVAALTAAISCRWAHEALVFWMVLLVIALGAIIT